MDVSTDLAPSAIDFLRSLCRNALNWVDKLSGHPAWPVNVTLVCVLFSMFVAFPTYDQFGHSDRVQIVQQQIDDITASWEAFSEGGEHSNLAFRVVVPLTARLLGLDVKGCLVLQFMSGVVLFYMVAQLASNASGSRSIGTLFAIGTAMIWAGHTAFVELRGNFDGVALALLAAAMYFRQPVAVALFVILAAWTQDRALAAGGFVYFWWVLDASPSIRPRWRDYFNPRAVAVVLGILCSMFLRWLLLANYPMHKEWNSQVLNQMNNLPLGVWSGLEGLWILWFLAAIVLWRRSRLLLFGFAFVTLFLIYVGSSVVDTTRTTCFLLPGALVALAVLHHDLDARQLRRTVFVAAVIAALWPAYYVGGKSSVWWHYPLPMHVLRWTFL